MANLERFTVDAKASRFSVKAVASGMTAGLGHNPTIAIRDFEGEAEFDRDALDSAALTMRIKAASLSVDEDMNMEDRRTLERIMHQEVLSTSRYPEVLYTTRSAKVTKLAEGSYRIDLTGNLTLRGVTRIQMVSGQVTIGPYSLRATGNFEVRQSNFDIPVPNVAGGLMKIRDDLKFAFYIVARQSDGSEMSRNQHIGSNARY